MGEDRKRQFTFPCRGSLESPWQRDIAGLVYTDCQSLVGDLRGLTLVSPPYEPFLTGCLGTRRTFYHKPRHTETYQDGGYLKII